MPIVEHPYAHLFWLGYLGVPEACALVSRQSCMGL